MKSIGDSNTGIVHAVSGEVARSPFKTLCGLSLTKVLEVKAPFISLGSFYNKCEQCDRIYPTEKVT